MWDKIKDYFQGYTRYRLYYSKLRFLLRIHIVEQFEFRISIMDDQCLFSGSCKICGCDTTALQMADRSCDEPCYPVMMNSKDWDSFKYRGLIKEGWQVERVYEKNLFPTDTFKLKRNGKLVKKFTRHW